MENKLVIIVSVWLAALGGLFLFSSKDSDYANIAQPVATASLAPASTTTVKTAKQSLITTTTLSATTTAKAITTTTLSVTTSTVVQPTTTNTTTSLATTQNSAPFPANTSTTAATSGQIVQQSQKININSANVQELEKITGVGPVIAQRIIDYRNANGLFQKIEDIKKVNGIGDVKFEKMKDEITI